MGKKVSITIEGDDADRQDEIVEAIENVLEQVDGIEEYHTSTRGSAKVIEVEFEEAEEE